MVSFRFIIATVVVATGTLTVSATTTIDSANKYAYSGTIGWVNAEGDIVNGAVIGQAFCSGYIYGANTGWIHLGDGSPVDNMAYANDFATDYGVNHDGAGNLTGYAYGANIGWVNFEQSYGFPRVDLSTGELSGYAWSANTGWINLSGMATLTLATGPDTDADGIPDAWEYGHTNVLTVLNDDGTDSDGDGVSDIDEYRGDTDPFDSSDYLWVVLDKVGGATNTLSWRTRPTRLYRLLSAVTLTGEWINTKSGLLQDNSGRLTVQDEPPNKGTVRFYRINAILPLGPE